MEIACKIPHGREIELSNAMCLYEIGHECSQDPPSGDALVENAGDPKLEAVLQQETSIRRCSVVDTSPTCAVIDLLWSVERNVNVVDRGRDSIDVTVDKSPVRDDPESKRRPL